jgi:cytochrome c biogenesis protein CcmG, thiol:disulfide interchange protein DsbE
VPGRPKGTILRLKLATVSTGRPPWHWFAAVGALLIIACRPAAAGSSPPSPPPLPSGFTRFTDVQFGFQIGLAPHWTQSGRDPSAGVSLTGPGDITAIVHFEEASSDRLDVAAVPVLAELSGGAGVPTAQKSSTTLAGRPAERVRGRLTAPDGEVDSLDAYVMVEGHRAWVVAMAGRPEAVAGATATWETMVSAFRLVGGRPTPPPRATVGLPAPRFAALDRVGGPVIINFFATWCVDCRTDMPVIAAAAAAHRGRVTVIGVDCCGDDRSGVPAFLRQLGVQGQFRDVVYDDGGRIAQSYALLGPPTTAFLDRNHVLREMVAGPVTPAGLDQGMRDAGAS